MYTNICILILVVIRLHVKDDNVDGEKWYNKRKEMKIKMSMKMKMNMEMKVKDNNENAKWREWHYRWHIN